MGKAIDNTAKWDLHFKMNLKQAVRTGSFFCSLVLPGVCQADTNTNAATSPPDVPVEAAPKPDPIYFTFEGISLGAIRADIKAKHPDLIIEEKNDPRSQMADWVCKGIKGTDKVEFNFVDGKLYEMTIYYSAAYVNQAGGLTNLYEKFVAQYGPTMDPYLESVPVVGQRTSGSWIFPDVRQTLYFSGDTKTKKATLTITDARAISEKYDKSLQQNTTQLQLQQMLRLQQSQTNRTGVR